MVWRRPSSANSITKRFMLTRADSNFSEQRFNDLMLSPLLNAQPLIGTHVETTQNKLD